MTATLSVPEELRDRLKRYGHKGDTYTDILRKLMDRVNLEEFKRESARRLDSLDESLLVDDDAL